MTQYPSLITLLNNEAKMKPEWKCVYTEIIESHLPKIDFISFYCKNKQLAITLLFSCMLLNMEVFHCFQVIYINIYSTIKLIQSYLSFSRFTCIECRSMIVIISGDALNVNMLPHKNVMQIKHCPKETWHNFHPLLMARLYKLFGS